MWTCALLIIYVSCCTQLAAADTRVSTQLVGASLTKGLVLVADASTTRELIVDACIGTDTLQIKLNGTGTAGNSIVVVISNTVLGGLLIVGDGDATALEASMVVRNCTFSVLTVTGVRLAGSSTLGVYFNVMDAISVQGLTLEDGAFLVAQNNSLALTNRRMGHRIDLSGINARRGSGVRLQGNVITAPWTSRVMQGGCQYGPVQTFAAIRMSDSNVSSSVVTLSDNSVVPIVGPVTFLNGCSPGVVSAFAAGVGIDLSVTAKFVDGSQVTMSNNSVAMGAVGGVAVQVLANFTNRTNLALQLGRIEPTLDVTFMPTGSDAVLRFGTWPPCRTLTLGTTPPNTTVVSTTSALTLGGNFSTISLGSLADVYTELVVPAGVQVATSLTASSVKGLESVVIRGSVGSLVLTAAPALRQFRVLSGALLGSVSITNASQLDRIEVQEGAVVTAFKLASAAVRAVSFVGVVGTTLTFSNTDFIEGSTVIVTGSLLDSVVFSSCTFQLNSTVVIENNTLSRTQLFLGNRIDFSDNVVLDGSVVAIRNNVVTAPWSSRILQGLCQFGPPFVFTGIRLNGTNVSRSVLALKNNSIVPIVGSVTFLNGCTPGGKAAYAGGVGIELTSSSTFGNGSCVTVMNNSVAMGSVGSAAVKIASSFTAGTTLALELGRGIEPALEVMFTPGGRDAFLRLGTWPACRSLTLGTTPPGATVFAAKELVLAGSFDKVVLDSLADVYEQLTVLPGAQVTTSLLATSMRGLNRLLVQGSVQSMVLNAAPSLRQALFTGGAVVGSVSILNAPNLTALEFQPRSFVTAFTLTNGTLAAFKMIDVLASRLALTHVNFTAGSTLIIRSSLFDSVVFTACMFQPNSTVVIENNTLSRTQLFLGNRIDFSGNVVLDGSVVAIRNNVLTAPWSSFPIQMHCSRGALAKFSAVNVVASSFRTAILQIVNNSVINIVGGTSVGGCDNGGRVAEAAGTGLAITSTAIFADLSCVTIDSNNVTMGAVGSTAVTLTARFNDSYLSYVPGVYEARLAVANQTAAGSSFSPACLLEDRIPYIAPLFISTANTSTSLEPVCLDDGFYQLHRTKTESRVAPRSRTNSVRVSRHQTVTISRNSWTIEDVEHHSLSTLRPPPLTATKAVGHRCRSSTPTASVTLPTHPYHHQSPPSSGGGGFNINSPPSVVVGAISDISNAVAGGVFPATANKPTTISKLARNSQCSTRDVTVKPNYWELLPSIPGMESSSSAGSSESASMVLSTLLMTSTFLLVNIGAAMR